MIQVQNGWLCYNWRECPGQDYPRFPAVRAGFEDAWNGWARFAESNNLGRLQPRVWEVTYVNYFDRGTVWQEYSDVSKVLPGLFVDPPGSAARFTYPKATFYFRLAGGPGRLQVVVQPAKRDGPKGAVELIQMRLTARGPIDESKGLTIAAGLELGHRTIVESFNAWTSEAAKAYWMG